MSWVGYCNSPVQCMCLWNFLSTAGHEPYPCTISDESAQPNVTTFPLDKNRTSLLQIQIEFVIQWSGIVSEVIRSTSHQTSVVVFGPVDSRRISERLVSFSTKNFAKSLWFIEFLQISTIWGVFANSHDFWSFCKFPRFWKFFNQDCFSRQARTVPTLPVRVR